MIAVLATAETGGKLLISSLVRPTVKSFALQKFVLKINILL